MLTHIDIKRELRTMARDDCDGEYRDYATLMYAVEYIEKLENKIAQLEAVDKLRYKDLPI